MHITDNFMKAVVTDNMASNMSPNRYAQMYLQAYQAIEKEVADKIEKMQYIEQRKNEDEPSLKSFFK